MRSLVGFLFSSLIVGAASVSFAQEGSLEPAGSDLWLLAKYDRDGDNAISMNEVTFKRDKMFSYMDDDADGIVSFDEYQDQDIRKRQLLLKARFDRLDLDRDGRVSSEEYRSYLGSFDRFDANGDGRITQKEISPKRKSYRRPEPEKAEPYCLLWVCVRSSID